MIFIGSSRAMTHLIVPGLSMRHSQAVWQSIVPCFSFFICQHFLTLPPHLARVLVGVTQINTVTRDGAGFSRYFA